MLGHDGQAKLVDAQATRAGSSAECRGSPVEIRRPATSSRPAATTMSAGDDVQTPAGDRKVEGEALSTRPGDQERADYVMHLESLGALGSDAVRQAIAAVRRHRFLEAWYHMKIDEKQNSLSFVRHVFDRDHPTPEDLEEIYSNRALVTAVDGWLAKSSTSQPDLIAEMLTLLDARQGHSVLEIGTGTGYNAALLRELVGSDGKVCSIEIQEDVAALARRHLDDEGYPDVAVLARDAYRGAAEEAPFDRIVATVGCSDISPYWLNQLKPDGFMLLPLRHGLGDPLIRIERDPEDPNCGIGRVIGYASFMPIEGELRWRDPWGTSISTARGLLESPVRTYPLPESLVPPASGGVNLTETQRWRPFQFFLSLTAQLLRRQGIGFGIAESALKTVVLVSDAAVHGYSLDGHVRSLDNLHDRLVYLAEAWDDLGRPNPEDYVLRFVPRAEIPDLDTLPKRYWFVDRLQYLEIVELP